MNAEVLTRAALDLREQYPDEDDFAQAMVELSRLADEKGKGPDRHEKALTIKKDKLGRRDCRDNGKKVKCPPESEEKTSRAPKQSQVSSVYSSREAQPTEGNRVGQDIKKDADAYVEANDGIDQAIRSISNHLSEWEGRAQGRPANETITEAIAWRKRVLAELRHRKDVEALEKHQRENPSNPKRLPPDQVSYTAAVLSDDARAVIVKKIKPLLDQLREDGWVFTTEQGQPLTDHRTLKYPGALSDDLANLIGTTHDIRVVGFSKTNKAAALIVSDKLPNQAEGAGHRHITIAVNPATGGKPKDSNEITRYTNLTDLGIDPFTIKATVTEIPKAASKQPETAAVEPKQVAASPFAARHKSLS